MMSKIFIHISLLLGFFLHRKARLDDKRMLKVKIDRTSRCDPPLIIDHYSVADRETLLGYPVGYVENVCEYFDPFSMF